MSQFNAHEPQVPPPPYAQQQEPLPQKSYVAALLLTILLGGLGVDRMYLGHWGLGIAKLFLSWLTFGVWWLIDLVLIATRKVNSENFVWDDEVQQPQPHYQAPPQAQYPPQA